MALEFLTPKELSSSTACEIVEFLDSQDTGHPFQLPLWSSPQSRLIVRREAGRIRWFANFGTQPLLGARIGWPVAIRSNRGPVCDDEAYFRESLAELADEMRQEGA